MSTHESANLHNSERGLPHLYKEEETGGLIGAPAGKPHDGRVDSKCV